MTWQYQRQMDLNLVDETLHDAWMTMFTNARSFGAFLALRYSIPAQKGCGNMRFGELSFHCTSVVAQSVSRSAYRV